MSRPLRILLTVDAVGGVWQYGCELARALARTGHGVTLAALGPAPSEAQRRMVAAIPDARLIETGLPLDWLAKDGAEIAASGAALARLAGEVHADLVQINQPALIAAAPFPVPVVAVLHSCTETWGLAMGGDGAPADFAWQTALVAAGLAAADAVVCPTRAFAATVQAAYDLPALPAVVHNGRTPLGPASGTLHDFAFTAGRLWDKGKGADTLDRAAARLGVPFKAAGALVGPQGERIMPAHLHALGSVEERVIAGCLAARPVFASAARYEPFGLAVLEAALAGCPLVLSDIPTFRELWDGAATFVAPDDADGFARAIEALVGDVPNRLVQGDLARRRAARYSPRRMGEGMAAIYRRLVTHTPAGRRVPA